MQRIESDNCHVCIFREPRYWSWIVAVPFYVAAAVFLPLWLVAVCEGFRGEFWRSGWGVLLLLAGGAYGLYKAVTTAWDWFGRRGCIVDRQAGVVTAQAGLFVASMTSRTVPLREFTTLMVHGWREVGTRTGRTFRTEYYLDLLGPGKDYVRLGRAAAKTEVRTMAEELAEFADLTLFDATYDPPLEIRQGQAKRDLFARALALLNTRP